MDTYSVQRAILQTELTPTDKLVGMALALHMDRKTGKIRVRQKTIAEECGVSDRTVRKAIANLVDDAVFTSQRTGRAALLTPLWKESGRVERKPTSDQTGKQLPPWVLDTTLSTRPEEEEKRGHARFLMEKARKNSKL